jgi:hypothetical protein
MGKQGLEMHQKLDSGGKQADTGANFKERRLDLSLPQVAGSALAAVAAAVLASQLGLYGTIIGAGVVSVIATCGGSIFQHLFRRTGEQIRVVTVQAKPRVRQVPVRDERGDPSRPVEQSGRTTPPLPSPPPRPTLSEEFGEATTHGTRVRGWKRPAAAAVVVFVIAMLGITGFELISGQDLSGGKGTTVGSVVGGGDRHAPAGHPATPGGPGQDQPGDGTPGSGGPTAPSGSPSDSPGGNQSGAPDTGSGSGSSGTDGHGGGQSQAPTPTPSGSGDPATPPTTAPTPTPPGKASTTPHSGAGAGAGAGAGTGATGGAGAPRQ